MDWLQKAQNSLAETRADNRDWDRRRNTDFNLESINRRPTSISEIDDGLSKVHSELDGSTTAKLRVDAAVQQGGEVRSSQGKKSKKKDRRKSEGPIGAGPPVAKPKKPPPKTMEDFHNMQAKQKLSGKGGGKRRDESRKKAPPPDKVMPLGHGLVHKCKSSIDGLLHSIRVYQTESHIILEAKDETTQEVHKTKTRSKASAMTNKSFKGKEGVYEELIRRLAFKQDLAALGVDDKKLGTAPRYMQQTGEVKKKKLVILKVGENMPGAGAVWSKTPGAGGGPPFFKQRMPIGDIIADVTAFTNDGGKTTTVTFYDSIYNCTAEYSFPSCAMNSLIQMKIAKRGEGRQGAS